MSNDKTFTQEQLDAIVEGRVAKEKAKIEKNYVPRETFTELENKYNETNSNYENFKFEKETKPKMEKAFIEAGGRKEAFSDIYNLHGDELKDAKDYTKTFSKLRDDKPYMFDTKGINISAEVNKGVVPKAEANKFDGFYSGEQGKTIAQPNFSERYGKK